MKKFNLRLLLGIVLLLGLVLIAGCSSCRTPTLLVLMPLPQVPQPILPLRVLGFTSTVDDGCPPNKLAGAGGYWLSKRVFEPTPGEQLPRGMATLCACDWYSMPSEAQSPPDYQVLKGTPLNWLKPELPVVATMGDASALKVDAIALGLLRDDFLHQIDLLRPSAPAAPQVTIGFPDSSPDSDGKISTGRDPHGFNVGWIAQDLTCPTDPGGRCLGFPVMALALDLERPSSEPDQSNGGSYGYPSQLAAAIHRIVNKWKTADPLLRTKHLVINVSVGWEPKFECQPIPASDVFADGPPPNERLEFAAPPPSCLHDEVALAIGSASVYEAIKRATCKGALVIAAAGNDMGYNPELTGPIYPAIWAPQLVSCGPLDERPLLYSVGGIGRTNVRIPISRSGSRPRLAAPAALAVAFRGADPSPDSYQISGTSVAAAVVSGTAATVWAYRPDLGAKQVMEILYASGPLLGEAADICSDPLCDIRRVSMSRAVCEACKATPPPGAVCPPLTSSDCPAPIPVNPGFVPGIIPGPPRPNIAFPVELLGLTYGQPTRPACPACNLIRDPNPGDQYWQVQGSLDREFFSENDVKLLRDPKLRVYSSTGAELGTFDLQEEEVPFSVDLTWSDHPVTGETSPSVAESVTPSTATITWIQTTNKGVDSVLTQQIPVK